MKNKSSLLTKLGAGLLAFIPLSEVSKADQLFIEFNDRSINNSALEIDHTSGASEGYDDNFDSPFFEANSPALDIYSRVSFDPYRLSVDARESDNVSEINVEIYGRDLSNPVNNTLDFSLWDFYGENNFQDKPIYANLYNSLEVHLGTFDIRNVIDGIEIFPQLTIDNGLSYKMDISFDDIIPPFTPIFADIPDETGFFNGIIDDGDVGIVGTGFGMGARYWDSHDALLGDGDIDGDGDVDILDVRGVAENYGRVGDSGYSSVSAAPLNLEGVVGTASGDVGVGGVGYASGAPEPTTGWLLAFGAMGLGAWGLRRNR